MNGRWFDVVMMKWWNAIRGGDVATAIAMQHECNRILEQAIIPLAYEGFNDTALTKATIDAAGVFKAGPPRRPTIAVPPERIKKLRDTLARDFGHPLAAPPGDIGAHDFLRGQLHFRRWQQPPAPGAIIT